MSYFCIDVESDGEIPWKYSMVCFGAVIVKPGLKETFYGKVKPISDEWKPDALAISGFSREEHLTFDDPLKVMIDFDKWIKDNTKGRPIFISDNIAFDFAWINFYFHYYLGRNPFGFSGRRIGDLYAGMKMDTFIKWKHLRKTKHDHNPVNDAKGNAEVLLLMQQEGLNIKLT